VPNGLPYAPSFACSDEYKPEGPPRFHKCYLPPLPTHPTPFFGDPPPGFPQPPGGNDFERSGVYAGFGPGMPLLGYLLDWGDCTARIQRRLAVTSILKNFPRARERRLAHSMLSRYTWLGDEKTDEFDLFLINAAPFVGWRWFAASLREWMDIAKSIARGAGVPYSLTPALALNAALGWVFFARQAWDALTDEDWPYDAHTMSAFWTVPQIAGALP